MTLWWSAALIAAGATVGVGLAGSALGAWREERSGRVYELTPRYVRVAGRAVAAAVALVAASVGGVMAAFGGAGSRVASQGKQPVAAVAPAPRSGAPRPDSDRAHTTASATPARSAAMAMVGQPSGGRLYLGTLPGVPGQMRVWLPFQYAAHTGTASVALQALVVRAPEGELAEVWEGLAGAVTARHANPFVAVAPADPCVLAGDDTALRAAVAGQFRVSAHPRSWAELGVDAGSSCAVAAELAHPDVYAGAVALGGALPQPATGKAGGPSSLPSGIRLLLAQAHRDTAGQAEASRLRSALEGSPDAAIRLSSVVRDATAGRERFRLVRMAADYVTEEFAAAARR